MFNAIDVVHFHLSKLSHDLAGIKAMSLTPITVTAKRSFVKGAETDAMVLEDREIRLCNISPDHPFWMVYKGMKRQVSLWLMVVHMAKNPGDSYKHAAFAKKLANHGTPDMFPTADRMWSELIEKLEKTGPNAKTYDGLADYLARRQLAFTKADTKVDLEPVLA